MSTLHWWCICRAPKPNGKRTKVGHATYPACGACSKLILRKKYRKLVKERQ